MLQAGEGVGLLDAIQVGALQVLDQRHLGRLLVGNALYDHWDRLEARHPRRAQTPLAQDQIEVPVPFPGRTTIGCNTPCTWIERESSCRAS